MYTLVIADDEQELREAIVNNVNWNSIGFDVVGQAENGIEALELVEKLNPDLLLTDIKMPFLSGIELAREAREISPAMNIAFLSGYDDFSYAQQAIQYNIISYILKPISAAELTDEMTKIRIKMDKKVEELSRYRHPEDFDKLITEYDKRQFLFSLMLGDGENLLSEEIKYGLRMNESENTNFVIQTVSFYDGDNINKTEEKHCVMVNSIMQKYVRCISIYSGGRVITIAAHKSRDLKKYLSLFPKEISQTAEKIFGFKARIGLSSIFEAVERTHIAYMEALDAQEYAFADDTGICVISDFEHKATESQIRATDTIEELLRMIKVENEENLTSYIDRIFQEVDLNNGLLVSELTVAIYEAVSSFVGHDEADGLVNQIYSGDIQINRMINKRAQEKLKTFAVTARRIISEKRRAASEIICDEVGKIIEEEYGDEALSLAGVSERLHISASYLSSLIKKVNGKNFITMLTDKRMAVAKEQIMYSPKKILEIAIECGYVDNHYFSYSFKKYFGVSPKKMRETIKENQ